MIEKFPLTNSEFSVKINVKAHRNNISPGGIEGATRRLTLGGHRTAVQPV